MARRSGRNDEPSGLTHRRRPVGNGSASPIPQLVGQTARRGHGLDGEILLHSIETLPKRDTSAEDDRHDDEVQEVDQTSGEELPDRRGAAADADVEAVGRGGRLSQSFGGGGADEMTARAVVEFHRFTRMVGEDETGGSERRLLARPAAPPDFGPWPRLGPEFLPPHDLGTVALTPHGEQRTVGRDGAVDGVNALDSLAVEVGEQRLCLADRLIERDELAGGEAVERDEET